MGEGLFDTVSEFRENESSINEILGFSVRELCLSNPDGKLKQTQYTQPCLFIVNSLYYYQAIADGIRPDYLAGHSLGEYNALLAAGCFDLLTGVRIVKKRGELMAQATNGGMSAVIGLDGTTITGVLKESGLTSIDVANYNSPTQTVISGPVDDIAKANTILEEAGASMCMPLPVSAAFHSRYMRDASSAFEAFLAQFNFKVPAVPVIANVSGRPYPDHSPDTEIRSLLVKQISHSVHWVDSIQYLLNQGVVEFKEIGPGNVLTGLLNQIR